MPWVVASWPPGALRLASGSFCRLTDGMEDIEVTCRAWLCPTVVRGVPQRAGDIPLWPQPIDRATPKSNPNHDGT
jgi:hypothetical protein